MRKTIDNIVNFVKEVKDSATPRENFGVEGYQAFINETREMDSSIIENQMAYNKNMAESDRVYNGEFQEELDLKKDVALYRANRVGELKKDAVKYLIKLDRLDKDCEIMEFNSDTKVMDSYNKLLPLENEFTKILGMYEIANSTKLSFLDRTKNVFYLVINKSKIKTRDETEAQMEVRVELEGEAGILKKKINNYMKPLNKDIRNSKNIVKKRKKIQREILKINNFVSRADDTQDFYEKYLDVNSNLVLNSSHTEIN